MNYLTKVWNKLKVLRFRSLRLYTVAALSGLIIGIPSANYWWYAAQNVVFIILVYLHGALLTQWYVDRRKLDSVEEVRTTHLADVAVELRDAFMQQDKFSDEDCAMLANIAVKVFKREM